jgi:hypothetical protein
MLPRTAGVRERGAAVAAYCAGWAGSGLLAVGDWQKPKIQRHLLLLRVPRGRRGLRRVPLHCGKSDLRQQMFPSAIAVSGCGGECFPQLLPML